MKALINAIKLFLETDLVPATIALVEKGLPLSPDQIPMTKYPYVALGDGGERVEEAESSTAQNRKYQVLIVIAVYNMSKSDALDNILDVCNSVKASIEKEANRQKDSHTWGINIIPFEWDYQERGFFMGRTVTVEYTSLETKFFDY